MHHYAYTALYYYLRRGAYLIKAADGIKSTTSKRAKKYPTQGSRIYQKAFQEDKRCVGMERLQEENIVKISARADEEGNTVIFNT